MKINIELSLTDSEIETIKLIGKDNNMVLSCSDFSTESIERLKNIGIINVDKINNYPLLTAFGWVIWVRLE